MFTWHTGPRCRGRFARWILPECSAVCRAPGCGLQRCTRCGCCRPARFTAASSKTGATAESASTANSSPERDEPRLRRCGRMVRHFDRHAGVRRCDEETVPMSVIAVRLERPVGVVRPLPNDRQAKRNNTDPGSWFARRLVCSCLVCPGLRQGSDKRRCPRASARHRYRHRAHVLLVRASSTPTRVRADGRRKTVPALVGERRATMIYRAGATHIRAACGLDARASRSTSC